MLTVSKMSEALEFLTKETHRTWTESELFDCVTKLRIDIHASTNATSQVALYTVGYTDLEELQRFPQGHELLATLYPANVAELWVRGETLTSQPLNNETTEKEYKYFVEPIKVTNADVRIRAESLAKILQGWNEAHKADARLHRYPKWMHPNKNSEIIKTQTIPVGLEGSINSPRPPAMQQRFQENEILRVIGELEHIATKLPKRESGKRGIKARVRNELEFSVKVFDKAWERLRANGSIKDE